MRKSRINGLQTCQVLPGPRVHAGWFLIPVQSSWLLTYDGSRPCLGWEEAVIGQLTSSMGLYGRIPSQQQDITEWIPGHSEFIIVQGTCVRVACLNLNSARVSCLPMPPFS